MGQSPGDTRHELRNFQVSLSSGVAQGCPLCFQQWLVTIRVNCCQPEQLTQALVSRVFIAESVTQSWSTHVTDLSYWLRLPEQKQAFIRNHIVRINSSGQTGTAWLSRPPAYENPLSGQNITRARNWSPRNELSASTEDELSLECAGFEQPRPAELTLFCFVLFF